MSVIASIASVIDRQLTRGADLGSAKLLVSKAVAEAIILEILYDEDKFLSTITEFNGLPVEMVPTFQPGEIHIVGATSAKKIIRRRR